MWEIGKKLNLGSGDNIFFLNFGKIQKFWSLGLGIFDEASVSKF